VSRQTFGERNGDEGADPGRAVRSSAAVARAGGCQGPCGAEPRAASSGLPSGTIDSAIRGLPTTYSRRTRRTSSGVTAMWRASSIRWYPGSFWNVL
jgi:hypothetical protein